MPYFKIPYSGYAVVEADSPEEAFDAYEDEVPILEEKNRGEPELIDEDTFYELFYS